MLKLILLSVLTVCWAGDVKISYQDGELKLLLPIFDGQIGRVAFSYSTGTYEGKAPAVKTSEGYEFRTTNVPHDATKITAKARVYDRSGKYIFITPDSELTISNQVIHKLTQSKRACVVIFRDDFNSINERDGNWKYEVSMYGGMNWEFQTYTPEARNIFTKNGMLYLYPTKTTDDPRWNENFLHTGKMDVTQIWGRCTNAANYGCVREGQYGLLPPVMSGKILSIPAIKYGEVEIRAKIPKGDWIWPAIWMLPKNNKYGTWPRSGEIDIMESRGNTGPLGTGHVSSTLHWGPSFDQNKYSLTSAEQVANDWHNSFHTWKLEWTPNHIKTSVDGKPLLNVDPGSGGFWQKGGFSGSNIWGSGGKMAPFDQEFYLILNVAVGGTNGFFPDNAAWPNPKPWQNGSPKAAEDFWNARNQWLPTWQGDNVAMIVDYIEMRTC